MFAARMIHLRHERRQHGGSPDSGYKMLPCDNMCAADWCVVQVDSTVWAPWELQHAQASEMCAAVSEWCTLQVDKHKSDASREVHEMQRRVEQEKTQRTCMMR